MAVDYSWNLVDPLFYLLTFNLGMGDSFEDVVDWFAEEAGISRYDDEDDEEDLDGVLEEAIRTLAFSNKDFILEVLYSLFTEDNLVEDILDDIHTSPEMMNALKAVHEEVGTWPNGSKVIDALEDNIFAYLDTHCLKAAEVGFQIGQEYYKYLTSPYIDKSPSRLVYGERIDDPIYSFEFMAGAGYYQLKKYVKDKPKDLDEIGIACKFYELNSQVIADFYICIRKSRDYWGKTYPSTPIHSIVITDFSKTGITKAAHEIANWMSNNIKSVVQKGLTM